jgi:hypothetical protein
VRHFPGRQLTKREEETASERFAKILLKSIGTAPKTARSWAMGEDEGTQSPLRQFLSEAERRLNRLRLHLLFAEARRRDLLEKRDEPSGPSDSDEASSDR